MPSTFYGLTIAGSGLNSFQTAVNTTANNIANVQTEGYTQIVNRQNLSVYMHDMEQPEVVLPQLP